MQPPAARSLRHFPGIQSIVRPSRRPVYAILGGHFSPSGPKNDIACRVDGFPVAGVICDRWRPTGWRPTKKPAFFGENRVSVRKQGMVIHAARAAYRKPSFGVN